MTLLFTALISMLRKCVLIHFESSLKQNSATFQNLFQIQQAYIPLIEFTECLHSRGEAVLESMQFPVCLGLLPGLSLANPVFYLFFLRTDLSSTSAGCLLLSF